MIRKKGQFKAADIKPGMWVNGYSLLKDGFCSAPMRVAKATPARVYVEAKKGNPAEGYRWDRTTYVFTSIEFLCDQEAEAKALYDFSATQCAELVRVRAAYVQSVDGLIELAAMTAAKHG